MANIKINSVPTRVQYIATAGQTVYTYNFPIKSQADLKVYSRSSAAPPDDGDDLLAITVDYTVTGANAADGGTVTLISASTVGDIVTIVGDKSIDRNAIYNTSSTIKKADLNNDFNDNVMYDKQTETELYQLGPRYNRSELIGPAVREDNTELPILNDGFVWQGRGDLGDNPDDIVAFDLASALNGGGGNITDTVTQVAHGFVVGDWIFFNGAIYTKALANTVGNAEVVGLVVNVSSADIFSVQQSGKTDVLAAAPYGALTPGLVYFLSDTSSGWISTTEPTTLNHVSKPSLIAITASTGWILPYRGVQNGTGPIVGGTGPGINVITVTQAGHGFVVEDVLRISAANTYAKAQADTRANAQAVGIVIEVVGVNTFVLQTEGFVDAFAGKAGATTYYLSASVAGLLTATEPTGNTEYSKPMYVALNAGSGYILEQLQTKAGVATGSGVVNVTTVTQAGHGFVIKEWLKTTAVNDVYALAQGDSLVNSRAVGMVIEVIDANTFVLQTSGISTIFAGLTAGEQHWLSAAVAGASTNVEPVVAGNSSKPLLQVVNATTAYILEQRPMLQPNANGGATGSGDDITVLDQSLIGLSSYDMDAVFAGDYARYTIYLIGLEISATDEIWGYFGTGAGPVVYSAAGYWEGVAPLISHPQIVIPAVATGSTGPQNGGGAAFEYVGDGKIEIMSPNKNRPDIPLVVMYSAPVGVPKPEYDVRPWTHSIVAAPRTSFRITVATPPITFTAGRVVVIGHDL